MVKEVHCPAHPCACLCLPACLPACVPACLPPQTLPFAFAIPIVPINALIAHKTPSGHRKVELRRFASVKQGIMPLMMIHRRTESEAAPRTETSASPALKVPAATVNGRSPRTMMVGGETIPVTPGSTNSTSVKPRQGQCAKRTIGVSLDMPTGERLPACLPASLPTAYASKEIWPYAILKIHLHSARDN